MNNLEKIVYICILVIIIGTTSADDSNCISVKNWPDNSLIPPSTAEQSGGKLEDAEIDYIDPSGQSGTGWGPQATYELDGIPPLSIAFEKRDARYDDKIEPTNSLVRKKALEIASKYPGEYSLNRTCLAG